MLGKVRRFVLIVIMCVEIITKILYEREFVRKESSIYIFEEFRVLMELEDKRLKSFLMSYIYQPIHHQGKMKHGSKRVPDSMIDTLLELGLTQASRTITRRKDKDGDGEMLTTTIVFIQENANNNKIHLATILLNPIISQPAIINVNIHNPELVDAMLIKYNIAALFMASFSYSYN
ncbi:13945_t:CDS:2 [Funneliformis caledonium]|uniref:13945_t:CDS:1 n=1 Tax=Funneliformis caledonium TaxID=1117310 RepID=A0A9N9EI53_9GLOM|nr:13945_t:CDS:2 [Funneliformis caledonium]